MTHWNEADLIADAQAILGPDEDVLGAGIFGMANLALGQTAGVVAGAAPGRRAGALLDGVGAFIDNPLLSGLLAGAGAYAGSHAGTHATAAAQGVSVRLLVAVTAEKIHVLNQDEKLETEVASFRRDAVDVSVKRLGASRFLTLTDTETGDKIELHGAVGWMSAQAAGDKVVLAMLQE